MDLFTRCIEMIKKEWRPYAFFGAAIGVCFGACLIFTINARIDYTTKTLESRLQVAEINPDIIRINALMKTDSNNIELSTQKAKLQNKLSIYEKNIGILDSLYGRYNFYGIIGMVVLLLASIYFVKLASNLLVEKIAAMLSKKISRHNMVSK